MVSEKEDKIINCPRCTNFFIVYKMRKIKHPSGIILDICDNCSGMWVDGDEISLLYSKKQMPKSKGGKNGKKAKK